jgi:hypothetical protein
MKVLGHRPLLRGKIFHLNFKPSEETMEGFIVVAIVLAWLAAMILL